MKTADKEKIPVLVIFAPTACGKTDFLLNNFSRSASFSVISADSMQVYRGMDVGTAKPSPAEQKILPHHLIDIKSPDEQFSVAEFVERTDALCKEIRAGGRIPLVCGGSGFYIRNFLLGLPETPAGDEALRKKLRAELQERGADFMWNKLRSVDAESAKKIAAADSYRVLRALEIYSLTGKPRSAFAGSGSLREQYDFCVIIFERARQELYSRIEARVDMMFEMGLEEEARDLMRRYPKDAPGLEAIGYREFFESCRDAAAPNYGEAMTTEQIRAKIKHDSKRYAKKQCVFMRGIPGAKRFLLPDEGAAALKEIDAFQGKWHCGQEIATRS